MRKASVEKKGNPPVSTNTATEENMVNGNTEPAENIVNDNTAATDRRYMEYFEAVRTVVQGHSEYKKELSRLKTELLALSEEKYDSLSARVFHETPKQQRISDPVYRACMLSSIRDENAKIIKRRHASIRKKLLWEKSLVNELPENQKQAIKLKWHDGLSWPEVSLAMKISERHAMRLSALGLHHMALSACGQCSEDAKAQLLP